MIYSVVEANREFIANTTTEQAIDLCLKFLEESLLEVFYSTESSEETEHAAWVQGWIDTILQILAPRPDVKQYFRRYFCSNCDSEITIDVFWRSGGEDQVESCLGCHEWFCLECQHEHYTTVCL